MGERNITPSSISVLISDFGLQSLIGKTGAIIPDARVDNHSGSDVAKLVERLLSISGEDHVVIPRKFKSHWQGKLLTRFPVDQQ